MGSVSLKQLEALSKYCPGLESLKFVDNTRVGVDALGTRDSYCLDSALKVLGSGFKELKYFELSDSSTACCGMTAWLEFCAEHSKTLEAIDLAVQEITEMCAFDAVLLCTAWQCRRLVRLQIHAAQSTATPPFGHPALHSSTLASLKAACPSLDMSNFPVAEKEHAADKREKHCCGCDQDIQIVAGSLVYPEDRKLFSKMKFLSLQKQLVKLQASSEMVLGPYRATYPNSNTVMPMNELQEYCDNELHDPVNARFLNYKVEQSQSHSTCLKRIRSWEAANGTELK